MSSKDVIIENSPVINGQSSSTTTELNEFYSSSPNLSRSSSSSSLSDKTNPNNSLNKINSDSSLSSNHRKESALKLPYPVLSDHRDPSSVLILLQKETQTTSKKISDVIQQINQCEQRLTLNIYTDNDKKTFKYERVKLKQQLDGLKKHERRVNLQIDFITTKTEIKGLEDEYKQMEINQNSDEYQQIKILLGKLKQKLDKMKIYMRQRNEQMKKITKKNEYRLSSSQKQQRFNSSSTKDLNRKRPSTSMNNSHSNKRLKSTAAPVVRLTSRVTSHESKKHLAQPIVRFINKTTESTINSASPTTPASSSSTLSSPLIKNSLQQNKLPPIDDDDELDLELNIDELFNDDSCSEQTMQRLKAGMNELTHQYQVKQDTSNKNS